MICKEYFWLLVALPGYIVFIWQIIEIIMDKQWGVLIFAVALFTLIIGATVAWAHDIYCCCKSRARFGGYEDRRVSEQVSGRV